MSVKGSSPAGAAGVQAMLTARRLPFAPPSRGGLPADPGGPGQASSQADPAAPRGRRGDSAGRGRGPGMSALIDLTGAERAAETATTQPVEPSAPGPRLRAARPSAETTTA